MKYSNGRDEIIVREASTDDIKELAALYKRVAITKDNYLVKLNAGDESFENTGGMFIVNDEESLKKIMNSPNEKLLVGLLNGTICGLIWYTIKGSFEEYSDISYYPLMDSYKEILDCENKEEIISPCGEIIAMGTCVRGVLSFIFFNSMMNSLKEMGYPYHMGEVYRVVAYDDENGHKEANLLNEKSYHFLQNTGGVIIGKAGNKRLEMDGFTVHIKPEVAFFDVNKCAELTAIHLSQKDWKRID